MPELTTMPAMTAAATPRRSALFSLIVRPPLVCSSFEKSAFFDTSLPKNPEDVNKICANRGVFGVSGAKGAKPLRHAYGVPPPLPRGGLGIPESFAFTRRPVLFARGSPTRGAGAKRLRGCTKDSLPVSRSRAGKARLCSIFLCLSLEYRRKPSKREKIGFPLAKRGKTRYSIVTV